MASTYLSTFVVLGVIYSLAGFLFLNMEGELCALASAFFVICGMLPDIDSNDDKPARELGSLLGGVSPLLLIYFFPELVSSGGMAHLALVVIACYAAVRIAINRGLRQWTSPKGMIHSIPAATIVFQLTYLIFWDLGLVDRLYISLAAFLGYMSHLTIEAYGNLDIMASAMGKAKPKPPILKFLAPTWGKTFFLYTCVFSLGYVMARDFYPSLPGIPWIR